MLAERHLALVMETEHRLLEQLFPRHILQHITEEFTSAVEPAAPGANATALSAATGGAGGGAHAIDFWRPGVRDYTRLATWHEEVTLLFADIKGFTPMCSAVPPAAVMAMLNDLFTRFDALLDVHGVFKVGGETFLCCVSTILYSKLRKACGGARWDAHGVFKVGGARI